MIKCDIEELRNELGIKIYKDYVYIPKDLCIASMLNEMNINGRIKLTGDQTSIIMEVLTDVELILGVCDGAK